MTSFGWSYPPGVSERDIDQAFGGPDIDCDCPEPNRIDGEQICTFAKIEAAVMAERSRYDAERADQAEAFWREIHEGSDPYLECQCKCHRNIERELEEFETDRQIDLAKGE